MPLEISIRTFTRIINIYGSRISIKGVTDKSLLWNGDAEQKVWEAHKPWPNSLPQWSANAYQEIEAMATNFKLILDNFPLVTQ